MNTWTILYAVQQNISMQVLFIHDLRRKETVDRKIWKILEFMKETKNTTLSSSWGATSGFSELPSVICSKETKPCHSVFSFISRNSTDKRWLTAVLFHYFLCFTRVQQLLDFSHLAIGEAQPLQACKSTTGLMKPVILVHAYNVMGILENPSVSAKWKFQWRSWLIKCEMKGGLVPTLSNLSNGEVFGKIVSDVKFLLDVVIERKRLSEYESA